LAPHREPGPTTTQGLTGRSFFGGAVSRFETQSGWAGFGLYYELANGEDPDTWANRLKPYLAGIGERLNTKFDVFSDGWKRGMEWRRVEVFGEDRERTARHHRTATNPPLQLSEPSRRRM